MLGLDHLYFPSSPLGNLQTNDSAGFTSHQVCEAERLDPIARTDEGIIFSVCKPKRKDTLLLFVGLIDVREVSRHDEPSNSSRGCERMI